MTRPVEKAVAPVVSSVPEVKGLQGVFKAKTAQVVKSNTPPVVLKVLGGVHAWWTKDRLKSVVQGTTLRRETDGLIIQGLFELSECVRSYD